MKKLLLLVSVFVCAASSLAAEPAKTPFTMNGWQFHEYSIPKLEEAVRRAPDYGVNFFIFSHGWFWSTEGFLASRKNLRVPPMRKQ